jgi:hypothetical protein
MPDSTRPAGAPSGNPSHRFPTMPNPTCAELHASFSEAMAKYPDPTNPSAVICAAVAVVFPEVELDPKAPLSKLYEQAERNRIQTKFYRLAYSIQGKNASDQEWADA